MLKTGFMLAVLTTSIIAGSLFAKENYNDIPAEARARMDYEIGGWRSETQYFNKDGELASTVHSRDERKYIMENRMVEISGVTVENGDEFRAWVYFDIGARKYTLTGINRNGRLLTMKGDLGREFSWTSDEMKRPNGSRFAIRFDHIDITPNSFTAVGLMSTDNGENWTLFSKQFLTRDIDGITGK